MTAITLQMPASTKLSDEQFYELCRINRDIRIERNASGELILMPPTGGETGTRNAGINAQLWMWNESKELGKVFDSSTAFKLPNGANRAPDASWVQIDRWNLLTLEQKEKFPPLCPDFVVELRSKTDRLSFLQAKLQEYLDNGAKLGWLINRQDSQVEIYRPNQEVKVLSSPSSISGEAVLPGFELKLKGIL